MGIGIIVIGIAWALTPPNPTSKKALLDLVKTSCSNIEALLEAIGVTNKVIYMPTKDDILGTMVIMSKRQNST